MNISSAAQSSVSFAQQTLSSPAEAVETGAEHDGDADDAAVAVASAAAVTTQTVNGLGQIVGTTISTSA